MMLWQKTNTTAIWENDVFQNEILNESGVLRHLMTFAINQSGGIAFIQDGDHHHVEFHQKHCIRIRMLRSDVYTPNAS